MQELLTVREAAQVLKLSPGTLRNWLSKKKMNYVKVLGATRIRNSDIQAILKPAILTPPPKPKGGQKNHCPVG